MKIDFTRIDDLHATLRLVIEQADYAPKMQELIAGYSKKVQLKGFRAGKTPKSVLQKMYGKGMLEEAVMSVLQDKLYGYLEENKIEYFASPLSVPEEEPLLFDPKNPTDYTFAFELGLKPEVTVRLDLESPIEVAVPAVDEAGVDADMAKYREVFGEAESITDGTVEAGDSLTLHITGPALPEGETISTLNLGQATGSAGVVLTGKAIGDELDADLAELTGWPREQVLSRMLILREDPNPDAPLQYHLKINAISRPQRTPLTGEQISRYVGREVEDEAAFRQILMEEEQRKNGERVNDLKKMLVRDRILKANPFQMPEAFLLKWVNGQRQEKIEAGSRKAEDFFRDAGWSFLLNRILEQHQLEVTDKAVQAQVYRWIFQNVDYRNADIKKMLDELYANEYFMSSMRESALEEVVFGHILPMYTFTEKEVPEAVFEETAHKMYHAVFGMGDHDHGPDEHVHESHEHSHAESH